MARQIGTLGTIETVTVGGRVFTDMQNLIILTTGTIGGALNGTLRQIGSQSGAGYTPSGANNFRALAVRAVGYTAGTGIELAQSDNDVGIQAATALTNPVYFGTEDSGGGVPMLFTPNVSNGQDERAISGLILNGKFCSAVTTSTGALVIVYGYEEAP